MNMIIVFVALAFMTGFMCGYGAERTLAPAEKLTDYEFRIVVQQILRDATISNELKSGLLAQLNEFATRGEVTLDSLHSALRDLITEAKKVI